MVAVVMAQGGVSWGALVMMLTVVPLGLLWAPQEIRRDKRVIVAGLVLALVVLSIPAFAAPPTKICDYMPWALECWLF